MLDKRLNAFLRWARHMGISSDRVRSLTTLASILSDDERLRQLRREAPVDWLDEAFFWNCFRLPRETKP